MSSLINLCERRAIVIPAFKMYGESAGFYDYGPIGTRIKRNIENAWRRFFIVGMGNLEIETTIVAPERIFEASGHLKNFVDPLINCSKCKRSYRADKLMEEYFSEKEDKKSEENMKHLDINDLAKMIRDVDIKCEACKGDLTDIGKFNLMLSTNIGPTGKQKGYLRPETAQGIFMDFKEIFRNSGLKLPIGIGQIGKVFRNEISPRNILLRMREFSQMEMEYFFDPEEELIINNKQIEDNDLSESVNFLSKESQEHNSFKTEKITISELFKNKILPNKLYAFLLSKEIVFLSKLGIPKEAIRLRYLLDDELPHYSKCNVDIEVKIENSFEEIIGNAYRYDFDLKNHQSASGKGIEIINLNKKIIPHVVEISFGIDRIFWSLLYNSLYKDSKREWDLLILNEDLAPYRYALFPLQKDKKLLNKARDIKNKLLERNIEVFYSESGGIGKRYAKSDEIGIPYSLTVDYDTLNDNTITIRNLKDTKQDRIPYYEIK